MRIAVVLLICLGMSPLLLNGDDAPTDQVADEVDDRSTRLMAFCQQAILYARGLACSPFGGSTDHWIVDELLPGNRFLPALDASEAMSEFSSLKPVRPPKGKSSEDDVLDRFQRPDEDSDKLRSKLTVAQRARLPGVYLRMEGLMALCRPDFELMFDDAMTQDRIRTKVLKSWEKAVLMHRALFTLKSRELAPLYQAELRRISADLDWQIVRLLNETERDRLLGVIGKSRKLDGIALGCPSL